MPRGAERARTRAAGRRVAKPPSTCASIVRARHARLTCARARMRCPLVHSAGTSCASTVRT
eukprot:9088688-Alexandrium_andersonii.AAC.1